jgi:hypothetical protein
MSPTEQYEDALSQLATMVEITEYASVDDLFAEEPELFEAIAREWRVDHADDDMGPRNRF